MAFIPTYTDCQEAMGDIAPPLVIPEFQDKSEFLTWFSGLTVNQQIVAFNECGGLE